MSNLPPELYNGQVLGAISYTYRCLENIDPEGKQSKIREDYKDIIEWRENDFAKIYAEIAAQRVPDLKIINKKGLVLQELARLVAVISPLVMKPKVVEAVYQEFKKQPDLWSSSYHLALNDLESAIKPYNEMKAPKKYFMEALSLKLKHHITENGLALNDEKTSQLIKLSLQMLNTHPENIKEQYNLLKTYMDAQSNAFPFAHILEIDTEKQLVSGLIEGLIPQISSETLKKQLSRLMEPGLISKALFNAIHQIFLSDQHLKDLSNVRIGEHQLSTEKVEEIYADAVKSSKKPLETTTQQCNVHLLGQAFPHSSKHISSLLKKEPELIEKELRSPEFLHRIIESEVFRKLTPAEAIDKAAATQLCNALKLETQTSLDPKTNIDMVAASINKHVELILANVNKRKEALIIIGFNLKTFKAVDAVMDKLIDSDKNATAARQFYSAIQQAKLKLFCIDNKGAVTIKQLEHISPLIMLQFLTECCAAGMTAAQQVADNRSFITMVGDVLKAIAKWIMNKLGCHSTPQFFKTPKTVVDDLSLAVGQLHSTLKETLKHIKQIPEPGVEQSLDNEYAEQSYSA